MTDTVYCLLYICEDKTRHQLGQCGIGKKEEKGTKYYVPFDMFLSVWDAQKVYNRCVHIFRFKLLKISSCCIRV